MTDKTLGAYERHESPDYADGGVAAALIEKEAENADAAVDYHAMWWKAEREREKAERERDEALASVRVLARDNIECYERFRAAEPRPLTPDAITDEMVKRGVEKFRSLPTAMSAHARVSIILTAALTEPPARPEGAEEIEFLIADRLGGDVPGDVIRVLADEIAERAGATRLYPEDGAA